jgi:signal transduction histidine kinase
MNGLLEDLLTLAREGNRAAELEAVDLATVIDDCWHTVETGSASLVCDTTRTIRADRSRVQQLVENLLGNAVDHGGEDVTVTVGDLPGGFYFEDDGAGIPDDERAAVFDAGYTTRDGGSGIGLSIVENVAETHGWSVTVTASDDGGARFEITGVEFEDE